MRYNREDAARDLEISLRKVNQFDTIDTFNNNRIEGYLSTQSDYRYGAMIICRVNDIDTFPQIIYGTPKIPYPDSKEINGEWQYILPHIDDNNYLISDIQVYEKMDGTAICVYSYSDNRGKRYISFKLRLTPCVKNNRFYSLHTLWLEIMSTNPEMIYELQNTRSLINGELSLTYEMWGYKLVHLVKYDTRLSANLLFGVDQERADIIPAHCFNKALCPLSPKIYGSKYTDLNELYNEYRYNTVAEQDIDGFITGSEGSVFYIMVNNRWKQFKNKPPTVENIHRSSGSIQKNTIKATAQNLVESSELSVIGIIELLEEEFPRKKIYSSISNIIEVYRAMRLTLSFFDKVIDIHNTHCSDMYYKEQIMRKMSEYFPANQMRAVYSYLSKRKLIV